MPRHLGIDTRAFQAKQSPEAPGASGRAGAETAVDSEKRSATDPRILCRACGHPVTRAAERISVAGAHRHTFANPSGIVYEIGCFRNAAGCAAVGAPSPQFTWFAGYAWRIGLCAACRIHLGWRFAADSGSEFFGLILNRLVESG